MSKTANIVFASGLGNALLALPAMVELRLMGIELAATFRSSYEVETLFVNLFKQTYSIHGNKQYLLHIGQKRNHHKVTYLDFFASTRKNILMASYTSENVVSNNPGNHFFKEEQVLYIQPLIPLHEHSQYAHLFGLKQLNYHFHLYPKYLNLGDITAFKLPQYYTVLQAGAGNAQTPYKSFDSVQWKHFLKYYFQNCNLPIVLIGDKNELELNTYLQDNFPQIINLCAKSNVPQTLSLLKNAQIFIGHDSFGMHASALLQVPTFTIWGGSNYLRYGYESYFPKLHKTIQSDIACWPCNDYLSPNTKRVENPIQCPDFKCIKSLSNQKVFDAFYKFYKELVLP